jgi:hypothetical protein
VTTSNPEPRQDEPTSLKGLFRETYDLVDEVVADTADEQIDDRLQIILSRAGYLEHPGDSDVDRRLEVAADVESGVDVALSRPASRARRSPTRRVRRRSPASGPVRSPAHTAPSKQAARRIETNRSSVPAPALPGEPVNLRIGFGLLNLEGRLGPTMARVARTLAYAVVAVVAVLHDARYAIIAITGLSVAYLAIVAAVAIRAVRNEFPAVRDDSRRVLRSLLGQDAADAAPPSPSTTYVTINGGGKTKINAR